MTDAQREREGDVATLSGEPWVTTVWNDPVNLMSYVVYVFQSHFGFSRTVAETKMREVHEQGRTVVSTGTREQMERDVLSMHTYGLWATLQRGDQ